MSQIPEEPRVEHRLAYHKEVDELKADLLRLGAMVMETVPRGTQVLLAGDLGAAKELMAYENQIDRLSVDIEERTYSIMARQAPIAGELRHLITITKLVGELERSGDLMVNVTKASRRMRGAALSPRIRGVAAAMSKEAHELLKLSMDAYLDGDDALAQALDDIDDKLDDLNVDMIEAVFDAHTSGDMRLEAAVQLALIARYYERIGDHAVNIGQRVTYMVTGWMPEHLGAIRANMEDGQAPEDAPPPG